MWWFTAAAFAGRVVVEAHVPAEISVDGQLVAQLYQASRVEFEVANGTHTLTFFVAGKGQRMQVDVTDAPVSIVVGRTGISTGEAPVAAAAPEPGAPVSVEFRVTGGTTIRLQLDDTRTEVAAGQTHTVEVPTGDHRLTVRAADGTVIWARGTLVVRGGGDGPVIVHVSEGHLPETSAGATFEPDGG